VSGNYEAQKCFDICHQSIHHGGVMKLVQPFFPLVLLLCVVFLGTSAEATTYYSTGSVDLATLTNWKTARDGTGTSPSGFTTAGDVFVIQGSGNGGTTPHAMTLAGILTIGSSVNNTKLQIENGASLTATAALTFGTAGQFQIDNGGTYNHNSGGALGTALFAGTESFGASSNFVIGGSVSPGTGPSTTSFTGSFGNFTFSTTSATTMQCNDVFPNVAGNFTKSSATAEFRMAAGTAGNGGFSIGGDFNLSAGIFSFGNSTVAPNLTISGNFNMTGGTFQTACTTNPSTNTVTFNKSGVQTFTKSSGTITAASSSGRHIAFVVQSGSTLDMGTNILNCAGSTNLDFTVNSGGTVRLGDPGGVVLQGTSATTGNIQTSSTSVRSFSTGGNYEFTGTSAQITGTGFPATVNNLTINNSNGVALSGSTAVNGTLALTSGTFASNGFTLTANGSVTRSTGYVDGTLTRAVGTGGTPTVDFYVGTGARYTPVSVAFTSTITGGGMLTANSTGSEHSDIGNSGIDNTKDINRFYTVTNSGITPTNYGITLNWDPLDVDGGANTANFVVKKKDGSWTAPTSTGQTSTSIQATGLTSFSDFAVGEVSVPVSAAPTVTSPIIVGATSVSGTSSEADGTTIEVYVDGSSVGTTTVSSGAWTKTGMTALTVGQLVKATATAAGKTVSAFSNTVTVQAVTAAPVVNSPIGAGATSVSGTSSEADGTSIDVYVDGSSVGTTTVSSGAWTKTGMTALTAGQLVKAKATAPSKLESGFSNIVTVQAVTSFPTVSSPIAEGATSVSGTSTEADGTSIDVYVDGSSLGTTTVSSNAWTKTGLTALTAGQLVKAKATASGKLESGFSNTVTVQAVSAAPVVSSPIGEGSTSVSGTSSEADATVIDVSVDGSSVGTTSVSSGAWTKTGMTALTTGQLVKAKATAPGKLISAFSNTVTVEAVTSAPTVSSPIGAGATSVSGTSTEADGTTIDVYVDGSSVGTTSVSSNAWTKSGMTALTAGQLVKAKATATGKLESVFSNTVTVQGFTSAPTVSSPIGEGSTSVSGTSTEADGTSIDVYVDGSSVGTTTVTSGAWTKTGMTALTAGQLVKAKATASGKLESGFSNIVTVQAVTSAPTVSSPIGAGATSVSGTSTEADGTSIDVHVDGSSVGTTTVSSNAWTKTGMTALTAGQLVKAKATASGKLESGFSNTVTVQAFTSAPVVSSPIGVGATVVSGTSTEADGTSIDVYVDGSSVGTTTVSSNAWSKSGLTALTLGQLVKAKATASGKLESGFSNTVTVSSALNISTGSSLPNATAGTAYSQTLAASGGTAPYGNWQVISGSLPSGLNLNSGTGEIAGTATVAGAYSFTAEVTDAVSATASKLFSLTVDPGSLDHIAIATISTPQVAGTAFSVSATAKDANNNTVTGFTGTVAMSTTAGTISPTTSNAFTTGTLTQSFTVTQSGTGKTIGMDAGSGHTGTSNTFDVNPGTLDHFAIAAISSPQVAGTAFSVSATAQDANNNTVTGFTGTVALSTTAGTISPTTSNGFTTGTLTQSFTVTQSGTGKTISMDAGSGHTGTSNTFDVDPGTLDHIAMAAISSPQVAGTAFSVSATAQDANNNTVTGFTGTVDMSTTAGTISPTTSNAFTTGTLTQSFTVTQSGTGKTIGIDAGSGHTGTSNTFTVNPGSLHHFAIATISSPQVVGASFSISVTAQDANNNTVTGFTGTVTLSTTAGTIAPTTSSSFTLGTLTQSVTVSASGTGRTIGVDDGATHTGTSNTFDVNPPPSGTILSNGTGGGVWSTGSTWAGGIVPSSVDSAVIRGTDSVSVTGATTCGGLSVQAGGKLGVGAKLTPTNVTLNGTITVSVDTLKPGGTMTVGSGGTYRHAQNGGRLPIATWNTGATLELTGIAGNAPSNGKQSFYNIVWNSPSQSASLNLGWQPSVAGTDSSLTINGDITVLSTGAGRWQMCAPLAGTSPAHTVARVNINGNVSVAGGAILTSNGTSNGFTDVIITILGNVSVSGAASQLAISRGSQGTTGTAVWNFKGSSFTMGAGSTTQNSNPTGGKWVFNKSSGSQTVTIDTAATLTGAISIQFGDGTSGDTVDIGNSRLGGSGCVQVIKAGTKVIVGPAGFIGGGTNATPTASTFTLENGATLAMAQVKGILSAGSSGAVQVSGTRSYGTGANYEYIGTNAQTTGGGLPATVNNLTINNAAGVTIDSTALVTVNGALKLTAGMLVTGSNVVFVPVAGTVGRTSGFVAGSLSKGIAAGSGVLKAFEIGDAAGYTPVSLSFNNVTTPGTLTALTAAGDHPQISGSGLNPSKSVNRYYTITNAGAAFDQYSAVFNYLAGDIDAGANTSSFIVGKYNGSTWSLPTVGTRTATSTQATGLTSFSDFAIGEAAPPSFTITASVIGSNGTISPSGAVVVNAGANQIFTMTPAAGYHIDSIFVDGAYAGNTSPDTIKNVLANHTIAVKFAINKYTILASVAGGSGTIAPSGAVIVNAGADQIFTMTPDPGYHIDSIFIDGGYSGNTSPDTFKNVSANHTIAVKFAVTTYTLTVNVAGSGSVLKNPNQANYNSGSFVQLTATPADYTWLFTGWSGDTASAANPLTVTMNANKTFLATFTRDTAYLLQYRSFSQDSIALDKDSKGKVGKFLKRKADKDYFIAHFVNDTGTVTGLHIEFGNAILQNYPFFTTPGSTHLSPDGKNKKWDITFTAPVHHGDSVDVFGYGDKGKVQKVSKYYWENGTALVGTKKKDPLFHLNDPKLPMPNRINVLFETFAQNGFGASGLLIGRDRTADSAKQYGWILAPKYTDAQKSLKDKTGLHTGSPRGFDKYTTTLKPILKGQKSIPPSKQNNTLIADMIALKLNIAASALMKTPLGFGELIYSDSVRIPTATVNIMNGKMVKEIAAFGDSVMMGYYSGTVHAFAHDSIFRALDYAAQRINAAFEGAVDTVDFAVKLHLKGTKQLGDVIYLRANHEVVAAKLIPLDRPIVETPQTFKLYQNYPNPFNPTTTIQFDLMEQSVVTLKIYNILGQEVATLLDHALLDDGNQELEFNAQTFASGVYFYRLAVEGYDDDGAKTASFQTVKKMMLLK
jgi:hypothetical protein